MKPEEFKAYGFAGCLHKPFTVAELFRELDMEGIGQMPALQDERVSESAAEHPAEHTSGTSAPGCPYNFSALTAFSGDDSDAADSILKSFISETRINAGRLQKAVDMADMDEVAAVSHKMIPLFTLIGATELVGELKILESLRGLPSLRNRNNVPSVRLPSLRIFFAHRPGPIWVDGHKHRYSTVFSLFRNLISKLIVYFVQLLIHDSLTFQ